MVPELFDQGTVIPIPNFAGRFIILYSRKKCRHSFGKSASNDSLELIKNFDYSFRLREMRGNYL